MVGVLQQVGVFVLLMLFLGCIFFFVTRNTWKMWDEQDARQGAALGRWRARKRDELPPGSLDV